MTDEQELEYRERLLAALERIAAALEVANYSRVFGQQPNTWVIPGVTPADPNGFTCSACGTYVLYGTSHTCGTITYSYSGDGTYTVRSNG